MLSFVAVQLLLGLLCLNEFLRPEVTSAQPKSCLCRQLPSVSQGTMVTTDPYEENNEPKLYCGRQGGQFLAVEENNLFHLSCTGATPITQAKGMLFKSTDQGAKNILFADDETCTIRPGNIKTGENAGIIAKKLWGINVPYDCKNCNMKHYLDYLSQGKATDAKGTCPVFKPLTSKTKIDFQKFRMAGKKVEYAWPPQKYTGSLTVIARGPSQRKSPSPSRVSNTTRPVSPRSQGFLSSPAKWFRSLSNTSGKNKKVSAQEKMHGTHGGGTTMGGTNAGYSYSGQAGRESGAANKHSAATGVKPLWGAQFSDWSSYWTGHGANAGVQQWGVPTGYIQ